MRRLIVCRGSGTRPRLMTLGIPESQVSARSGLIHARSEFADSRIQPDHAAEASTMRSERTRPHEIIGWKPPHFHTRLHESVARNRVHLGQPTFRSAT